MTNQTDNATNSVAFRYDAAGNLTNLIDEAGNLTTFRYDAEGRQTAKVYPDGETDTYDYDAEGRLTDKQAPGVLTMYRYDAVGNLTNIDYQTDADVFFAYDELNRMVSMSDAVGTTLYTYDGSCSRVSSADGPFSGDTITYGYDTGKRLTSLTSAFSAVHYSYDALDRITAVVSSGSTNTITYAGNGRLLDKAVRGNGAVVEYAYDALNRLTNLLNRTSGGAALSSFGYTLDNSDQRVAAAIGGPASPRTVSYGYDPIGQLIDAQGDFPGHDFAYAYDKRGNPTHQDRNGYVLTNQFNDLNQNVTSRWSGTLTVQGVANITNGSVTVNTQDAALRAAPGGAVFTATNLPVSAGSNLYTAVLTDPFGRADTNQVAVQARDFGYQYDRRGNLTSDGVRAYSWNDADRLVGVTDLESGQTIMTCTYDGHGRRRERVLYADGGSTNRYTYGSGGMNWLVLAITDGADNLLEDYVHGPDLSGSFGGAGLARHRAGGSGAGGIGGILSVTDHQPATSTHFFHYDGNGNIVTVTDEDEAIAASYEYSPFGVTLVESGTFDSRYRFSSKEWNEPVGLYYYGYRYYSPTLGRWLNKDPLSDEAFLRPLLDQLPRRPRARYLERRNDLIQLSLRPVYLFVNNSPTHFIDKLGLEIDCPCAREHGDDLSAQAYDTFPSDEYGEDRDELWHCFVGCRLAQECNVETAVAAGVINEIIQDYNQEGSGDPSPRDVQNTRHGAQVCGSDQSRDCESCCLELLESGALEPTR